MKKTEIAPELPHDLYPIDRWAIVETAYTRELTSLLETVLALGNGRLGVRGTFHQGAPVHQGGALINGFYETWPIIYPEPAYGFATTGQTIVYVPDPTLLRLAVNGEVLDFDDAQISNWERRLDFKTGILTHRYHWETLGGIGVDVEASRLVSIVQPDLIACRLAITVDAPANVVVVSELTNRQDTDYLEPATPELDPRRAKNFGRRVLEPTGLRLSPETLSVAYETVRSRLNLAVSKAHRIDRPHEVELYEHPDRPQATFSIELDAGEQVTIEAFTSYHTSSDRGIDDAEDSSALAAAAGFEAMAHAQEAAWSSFWDVADVHIGTDKAVQQAVRWILFNLHQASAQIDRTGIPAKGVTGQAYEGHYFWDTEIFVLPFLIYTSPKVAASLLRFRYDMLDEARERARVLSLRGALFPWRTINGEEASAYYAAGTAQYHIDADIAYAIRKYVEVTGDDELLWDFGVEILIETARMWADLGFHRDGAFHIYGVTGPDEYTALVDDNAYTNLMAQMNLRYAVTCVERMRSEQPSRWERLRAKVQLADEEIEEWRRAADDMYVGYDPGYGITKQDESFLAKERWDFDAVPADRYPLLLHFHPLVIYRYQVLKQADVVMAMFLLGDQFSPELKRANFEYYDPLTTGDSSLSACVQSIMAAEIGHAELAMRYFRTALFTDLADLHGNTTDGIHLASAGGVWMAVIYGMAGMRDTGGDISFDPRLPEEWRAIVFKLLVRGVRLSVDLDHERIALSTDEGKLDVTVRGEVFTVTPEGVSVPLAGNAGRASDPLT
ncbi:MAG TPA: glycosyl hydrolase family 65 protein [Acidimicrobiia bacterium]|nr:glycosyl hydrolase family 65 protein [Acidimicrobiia bacterium]